MNTKTKKFLTGSLIIGTVLAGGAGLTLKHVKDKKEESKAKKELQQKEQQKALETLTSDKAMLDSMYVAYNKKHNENIVKSKNFIAVNPSYNNVDSLYVLTEKVYNNVRKNHQKSEKAFETKIANICKKFCRKDGKYAFYDEAFIEYRKPNSLYEWMEILMENSENIPNYVSLEKENARLEEIDNLLYSFGGFMQNKFGEYMETSPEQKGRESHSAQKIIDHDTLYFENGYYLAQETYKFMDDDESVYKYNTIDNIKQDEIVKVLYRDYLKEFKRLNAVDEELYNTILDLMLTIRQHNEIESGVASYNVAVQDVSKRRSDIEQMIIDVRGEVQR